MEKETFNYPSVEAQREWLSSETFTAPKKYRIVFVGRFFQGSTGIVSSLHRALEGLGHTVFPLDPSRHPEVLDRSSGAQGGYGPIFFRPENIRAIFDSFAPDIIVFCAGGVVLDEEAKKFFKDEKILTVGLTLSDPDVQDSVIDWVSNFDFHTTNAELSLNRYLEEGHSNTLLMPFGIDREYILRRVVSDPDLAADAICIGHAQNRPDRHEVMTELAKHLDVKVYGNGWPLPSETVAGERLLQAAHAGTFHVNFPATRAGFTNVKCGVFETIGVGAVLCTSEFDEMSRLFDYGTEIIGYSSAEDLTQKLKFLKQNPHKIEEMRRQSFYRLIHEHLYEHRWLKLFENIEHALLDERIKPGDESRRLSEILSNERGRPRTVIVSGFYGARNRGDDLLLKSIAEGLLNEDPNANILVAAANPKIVEAEAGFQAFNRANPHESEKFAASATGMILGGGGLWHDYTIARAGGVSGIVTGAKVSPAHLVQLPLMVKSYGGQFHVYGMGVGPLEDEAARAAVRLTGSLASSVILRDEISKNWLGDIPESWDAEPVIEPDAVYGLDLNVSQTHRSLPNEYVLLNLRPWGGDTASQDRIRKTVLGFAESNNLPVVGLAMQPVDVRALVGANDEYASDFHSIVGAETPLEEFLDVISRASMVVAMRLHANLLGHRLGVKCIGFAYDPKVQAHFEEIERADFVLPMETESELLNSTLSQVLNSSLSQETFDLVKENEQRAKLALAGLSQQIVGAKLQVSPIKGMVHEPIAEPKAKPASNNGIWDASESVHLGKAVAVGGNLFDQSRQVPVVSGANYKGRRLKMDLRAPIAGDYVELQLPIETNPGEGIRTELWIKQRYAEKEKIRGYMEYSVLIDDTEVFSHEVAEWNPRNTVWLAFKPTQQVHKVCIRLKACRDTKNWNWGTATELTLERARVLKWENSDDFAWGASSPYARGKILNSGSYLEL